jgi:RimJ/RimL family protein N-acetyltransferase
MIRELTANDAPELARLLASQRPEYLAHFHPFDFEEPSIRRTLEAARKDRFWVFMVESQLAGFFMLRGFDQGYARPSFGVFVAEQFQSRGIARAALAHSIRWCEENGVERLMLKVSAENPVARRVYLEAGFQVSGMCDKTGHEIMELSLNHLKS